MAASSMRSFEKGRIRVISKKHIALAPENRKSHFISVILEQRTPSPFEGGGLGWGWRLFLKNQPLAA
ncbi:MAG: hypothetical protein C4567_06255 [Deltaproteobacteria bacterium]|nr:MAG: hypothetical protein C4567_06255 [Deltaproteobacteria bacterium]